VPGWVPNFLDDSDDEDQSDDGFKDGNPKVQDVGSCGDDSDVAEVPKTLFEESTGQKEKQSEDPFGFTTNDDTNEFYMNKVNVRSVNDDNLQNCNVDEIQTRQEGNNVNKGSKTGVNLLIVAVYAPHDLRDKHMLWDYLAHVINKWDGEVVISMRNNTKRAIEKYKEELEALDAAIDKGNGSDDIVNKMMEMDLERDVSKEELKRAVWDCGMDKSPGPDGICFIHVNNTGMSSTLLSHLRGEKDARINKSGTNVPSKDVGVTGIGEFSVALVRKVIDEKRLSNVNAMTRWIKCVPIKVNVLAWKIKIDALLTRLNISRRGGFGLWRVQESSLWL
nr:RNA-directed DNA polymerase, eukaryota [Tanacetum cinerariifolium]